MAGLFIILMTLVRLETKMSILAIMVRRVSEIIKLSPILKIIHYQFIVIKILFLEYNNQ